MDRPYPHCVVFAFFFDDFDFIKLRHMIQNAAIRSGFMPRNETITAPDCERFELALKQADENTEKSRQADNPNVVYSRWETPHGTSWNIEFTFPVHVELNIVPMLNSLIQEIITALEILGKKGAEVSAWILWEKNHTTESRPLDEMVAPLTRLFT